MDLGPGDHFAGLRIEGVAGRGGMGVVYRAVQPSLDRIVALKTIAPALAADPTFSARFVRESKAAAAVEHPNVLPIFSAGEESGVLYIVMRYVDGPDLRSLIREHGRVSADRAAGVVAQIAAALDAAHGRGLVHRDVKPANILLDPFDHAYLTDFGLTKRLASSASVAASAATRAGGWVGTLGYVAPEQIRDERVDARTDVYALGCVLFHALKGEPPYERSSDEATLWAHLNDAPPPLPPGLPPGLDDVVRRALAKAPADRFPTTGDLGRAVLAAVGRPARTVPGLASPRLASSDDDTRSTPPGGAPATAATTPALAQAAATTPATAATAPVAAATGEADAASQRRPGLLPALAAALIAATVVAVVALAGGGREPVGSGPSQGARTPPLLETESVRVGTRPTGLAITGGKAYVTLPRGQRLSVVDLGQFRRARPGPRVGRGAQDIDAGFGALWVTTASDRERLIRIDRETGARTTTALPDGQPVAVEAGENAVWVGIRGARFRAYPPPVVVRVDPRSGQVTKTIPIPRGVQDMTVGNGAVWISNRAADSVTRLDVRTGALTNVSVGRGPSGLAVGGGAVWTANSEESTVSRIDRGDVSANATIGVAGQPRFAAYGRGSLWVTTFASSTLVRIDGKTGRQSGVAVGLDLNPTKLAVSKAAVYVISQAEGRLQRVRFAEPRE